ncbi:MAG: HAD family hydrolase [Candidatus Aenigmarchaeota archaeon]|nr:HAD family hydrolase [Candidatus Aenigmarchaeota archaeon]
MDIRLVVFDWSGTIIDDSRPVYETMSKIFDVFKKPMMPFDQWKSFMSNIDSANIFKSHGIEGDPKKLGELWETNLIKVIENTKSIVYPDSVNIMQYIASKGKMIAVVSAQPEDHVRKEAVENGMSKFITRIIGEAFEKSIHLRYLCEEFGTDPRNAVYVGDMVGDIQAAKMAGMMSVAITRGYNSEDILAVQKPDFIISELSELRGIV